MARINNKDVYAIDNQLSLDDFVIGSNADNADETRNYLLRGIFSTFKTSLDLTSIEFTFAGGSDPDIDETDAGFFTTNSDTSAFASITTLNINKTDLNSVDISSVIDVINQNVSSFTIRLAKPSASDQVFYFSITSITDNTTHYTLAVTPFVGGTALVDETTYGVFFDLSGVPSVLTETDPVFSASAAAGILSSDITNWDTAYGWGDHALAGYQAALSGTGIVKSTGGTISYLTDNSSNWDTAYSWGDHALAGYLTSYTETDPVFAASAAATITTVNINQWNTAYGWGDHAVAGYITSESDPVFSASVAAGITLSDTNNWDSAYAWGDHAAVGYLVAADIDTFAELQAIVADATLVQTGDNVSVFTNDAGYLTTVAYDDLSDVAITTPSSGHVVVYNGASWANRALTEADISDLQSYLLAADIDTFAELDAIVADKSLVNLNDGGTFSSAVLVPDDPYDAAWNGSSQVPTKNAIYDKIESLTNSLEDLTDTTITSASAFDFLRYSGSAWVNVNIDNLGAGSAGASYDIVDLDTVLTVGQSAFYQSQGAGTTNSPDAGDGYVFVMGQGDVANRGAQIAMDRGNTAMWFRTLESGTWNTLWSSANDGSGSGLDADTLDGVEGSQFLRSDAADVKTSGNLTFNDGISAVFGTGTDAAMSYNSGLSALLLTLNSGVTNFNITDSGTNRFQFGRSSGNMTMNTGDLTLSAGSITLTSGSIIATSGSVSVADQAYADSWNGSQQVPTKNAMYDKIESLESFGAATFSTSNTSNTGNNKWTKFASIALGSQFNDYQAVLVYQNNNHPDAANGVGHISLRAKQQDAFGNDPVVSINNWYFDEQATNTVTVGYVIVQNTPTTVVDFYIKINDTFCVVSANVITSEYAEPDNITWYSSQAFESSTPSGLVEGTSTELWNSTGVQVLDEHSFESVDTDTITITASGSTTQIRSYFDSVSYADLGANTQGGFLRLTEDGGTSTILRGYGDSEFYGGSIYNYGGSLYVDGGTANTTIRNIREVSSVDYHSSITVDGSGRATFISSRSDNANTASVRATAGTDIDFLINSSQYMSLDTSRLLLGTSIDLTFSTSGVLIHSTTASRDKLRVWSTSAYTIGMDTGFTYGGLNSDFAMTFQMNDDNDRGWWWGDSSHSDAQGAMALTTQGKLTVASYTRIGYGESDTTIPGTTYMLQVNGEIQASDFVLSSDLRLKEDVRLAQVKPIDVTWKTFRFKDDDKKAVRHGVIAQELEEKHPEFVVTDDEGMKSVRYTDLLIAKNIELEARIEQLENMIANLVPSLN